MNVCITRSLLLGILALSVSAGAFSAQPDELFQTHVYSDTVLIEPGSDMAFDFDVDLIVSGPDGFYHRESFLAGSVVEFTPSKLLGNSLSDGVYHFELRFTGTGLDMIRGNNESLHLPATVAANLDSPHSGTFAIADGSFVSPDLDEPVAQLESSGKYSGNFSLQTEDADGGGSRDQVINDDLIVNGSTCVGLDCVNGENFGFDTIRMKENNTRLQFTDTSSSSSFPNNNWQIRANDSANGGANYLGIIDQGASGSSQDGTRLFTVSAGAPAHSLFVAGTGRVGLRTSTPVLDLHVNTGNTPGIRLEQNSSSGFTAQTWDMAGNEANFFVRDVTGGSRLPFRIRPGAPTSSIDIAASGNVGIGTASPSAALSIERSNGTAKLLVKETSATSAIREVLVLANHGRPRFVFENTDTSDGGPHKWTMDALNNGRFRWTKGGSGSIEMELLPGGDLVIAGTLTQSSDRNKKDNFQQVDPQDVLERVVGLPITRWTFNHDASGAFHMGPMAQDFYAAFGLGMDETKIAPLDTSGVTLAAIQGLKIELGKRDQRISELEAQVNELKSGMARVAEVEARLQQLDDRIADAILVNREDISGMPEVVQSPE